MQASVVAGVQNHTLCLARVGKPRTQLRLVHARLAPGVSGRERMAGVVAPRSCRLAWGGTVAAVSAAIAAAVLGVARLPPPVAGVAGASAVASEQAPAGFLSAAAADVFEPAALGNVAGRKTGLAPGEAGMRLCNTSLPGCIKLSNKQAQFINVRAQQSALSPMMLYKFAAFGETKT